MLVYRATNPSYRISPNGFKIYEIEVPYKEDAVEPAVYPPPTPSTPRNWWGTEEEPVIWPE